MRNNLFCCHFTVMTLFMALILIGCQSDKKPDPAQQRGRVIETTHRVMILEEYHGSVADPVSKESTVASVRVALAETEEKRNAGLMDVYDLPSDAGMYFIFEEEAPRSFWMVNTPLPLDILFMDRNHQIIRIRTHTTPFSRRPILSDYPARYVLEVHAGFAAEHDIREGMFVVLY